MLKLLAFSLPVVLVPGWTAAATAPRWALLFVLVPLVWAGQPRTSLAAAHFGWLGLLALAWLSQLWSAATLDGLLASAQLTVLVLLVLIGSRQEELGKVWLLAALGTAVSSPVAIGQNLGWIG